MVPVSCTDCKEYKRILLAIRQIVLFFFFLQIKKKMFLLKIRFCLV